MKKILFLISLCICAFGFLSTANAAPKKSKTKIIYKKKTSINFDDAIVEGNTSNPEGVYIVTPPEKEFGSLLRLRPNFHRELIRDSLLLK